MNFTCYNLLPEEMKVKIEDILGGFGADNTAAQALRTCFYFDSVESGSYDLNPLILCIENLKLIHVEMQGQKQDQMEATKKKIEEVLVELRSPILLHEIDLGDISKYQQGQDYKTLGPIASINKSGNDDLKGHIVVRTSLALYAAYKVAADQAATQAQAPAIGAGQRQNGTTTLVSTTDVCNGQTGLTEMEALANHAKNLLIKANHYVDHDRRAKTTKGHMIKHVIAVFDGLVKEAANATTTEAVAKISLKLTKGLELLLATTMIQRKPGYFNYTEGMLSDFQDVFLTDEQNKVPTKARLIAYKTAAEALLKNDTCASLDRFKIGYSCRSVGHRIPGTAGLQALAGVDKNFQAKLNTIFGASTDACVKAQNQAAAQRAQAPAVAAAQRAQAQAQLAAKAQAKAVQRRRPYGNSSIISYERQSEHRDGNKKWKKIVAAAAQRAKSPGRGSRVTFDAAAIAGDAVQQKRAAAKLAQTEAKGSQVVERSSSFTPGN